MRRPLALVFLLALIAAPAAARRADEARTHSFDRLNAGVRAYNRGEFLKAEELLLESYNIHLNNFRAAYYLGLARMGARKYDEALEPLDRALDYRPRDLPARVSLGEVYLKMGDLTAARTELYRALEVREDYSPAFDGLGRLAEASGQNERARELFLKAITADMGNPDPHMNLGIMSMRLGRLGEALRSIEKAVSLRPDYAKALGMLARIRTRLGQYNDALSAVREAMKLEPGNPAHAEALGRVYMALGDQVRSEEAFHAALRLDSDYVEASDGLALALRRQGKFVEAADTLEWAADRERIDPVLAEEFRQRARVYRFEEIKLARLKRELLEEASPRGASATTDPAPDNVTEPGDVAAPAPPGDAADPADGAGPAGDDDGTAREAVAPRADEPPDADDFAELAQLSASVRDWELAALAADRAVTLRPDDDVLARQHAFYLLRSGRVIEARDAYTALEARGIAEPADILNLGVAHARLGGDGLAIEAYGRARDTGLAPAEADLFLGLALERTGRRDEARAALERYMDRAGGDQGDTSARIRRYLDMIRPPAAPPHDEVFADEPAAEAGDDEAGDGEKRP